jgi:ribosomal protein S18 acetylase RimI-like enzyme
MRVRSLGYLTDLAIRQAEGGEVIDCGDHIVVRSDHNPGFWWGNFLLLAAAPAADDLDGWQSRFAAQLPAARHRAFGIDVISARDVNQAVFTAAGFRPESSIVLTAGSVREPRRPNQQATYRHLAGDDDWRQAADLGRACYPGDDPGGDPGGDPGALERDQDFAALRTASRRRLTEAGDATWFGAFAAGRLVAQLGLVPAADGLARYQDVETHPAFRRQGLAGTLVWRAARFALDELDASTLVIVADPGYHAIGIYESLGFRQAEDQIGFELAP